MKVFATIQTVLVLCLIFSLAMVFRSMADPGTDDEYARQWTKDADRRLEALSQKREPRRDAGFLLPDGWDQKHIPKDLLFIDADGKTWVATWRVRK